MGTYADGLRLHGDAGTPDVRELKNTHFGDTRSSRLKPRLAAQCDGHYRIGLAPLCDHVGAREPHVCVIVRDMPPNYPHASYSVQVDGGNNETFGVRALLATLQAQTYGNLEVHLVNAVGGGEIYESEVSLLHDERFHNGPTASARFKNNTWGYEATNFALENLLHRGGCDYFLFTNGDNLYSKYFLSIKLPAMRDCVDLVGSQFVSNHPRSSRWALEDADYEEQQEKQHLLMDGGKFALNHVDLGVVLVSEAAIKSTGARFKFDGAADWLLFDEIMRRPDGHGWCWYEEVLFIHQRRRAVTLSS